MTNEFLIYSDDNSIVNRILIGITKQIFSDEYTSDLIKIHDIKSLPNNISFNEDIPIPIVSNLENTVVFTIPTNLFFLNCIPTEDLISNNQNKQFHSFLYGNQTIESLGYFDYLNFTISSSTNFKSLLNLYLLSILNIIDYTTVSTERKTELSNIISNLMTISKPIDVVINYFHNLEDYLSVVDADGNELITISDKYIQTKLDNKPLLNIIPNYFNSNFNSPKQSYMFKFVEILLSNNYNIDFIKFLSDEKYIETFKTSNISLKLNDIICKEYSDFNNTKIYFLNRKYDTDLKSKILPIIKNYNPKVNDYICYYWIESMPYSNQTFFRIKFESVLVFNYLSDYTTYKLSNFFNNFILELCDDILIPTIFGVSPTNITLSNNCSFEFKIEYLTQNSMDAIQTFIDNVLHTPIIVPENITPEPEPDPHTSFVIELTVPISGSSITSNSLLNRRVASITRTGGVLLSNDFIKPLISDTLTLNPPNMFGAGELIIVTFLSN